MGIKNRPLARLQPKWFSVGLMFSLEDICDIFGCYNRREAGKEKDAAGIYWVEPRGTAKNPTYTA